MSCGASSPGWGQTPRKEPTEAAVLHSLAPPQKRRRLPSNLNPKPAGQKQKKRKLKKDPLHVKTARLARLLGLALLPSAEGLNASFFAAQRFWGLGFMGLRVLRVSGLQISGPGFIGSGVLGSGFRTQGQPLC